MKTREKQIAPSVQKPEKQTTASSEQLLLEKKDEMRALATVMQLYTRVLSFEESQEIANIEYRLEFSLKELVSETRLREADLKIKAMKDTLAIAKGEVKL